MKAPKVWDIKKKIMHEPEDIARLSFDKGELCRILLLSNEWLFRKDMEVLRPTGIPDCNGDEIFEGHIITDGFRIGEVKYDDRMGVFFWSEGEDWGMIKSADVEIIGHKYEEKWRDGRVGFKAADC